MSIYTQRLAVILLSSLLTACGGSDNVFVDPGAGTGTGTGTGTGATTTQDVRIGNCTGGTFTEGVVSVGVDPLSAGGTTSVEASLVIDSDCTTPFTTSTDISFSSTCTGTGQATLDSPVTTNNGRSISNYAALGCDITDTITATATVDGTQLTASGEITVLPATVGSITFVSATPETIAIKGTGGTDLQETSTVIFKVLDDTGGVVRNQEVDFELSTTLGGITFTGGVISTSGFSNSAGEVQVIVNSGLVHTAVRVTATVTGTSISTQSVALTITTGVPDQDSFSLAVVTQNLPGDPYDVNGVTTEVTIFAADHFNNPAPDGTSVAFTTEGGFIEGNCETVAGTCTVIWTSSDPRPHDGRVTLLATATGDESFTDVNGSGDFDDADLFAGLPFFGDLPEAYRDDNEDGIRDDDSNILTGAEEFLDFDVDNTYDLPDDMYNGVLCAHSNPAICDPLDPIHVHVRSQNVIVMTDDDQIINATPPDPAFNPADPVCGDARLFTIDPTSGFFPADPSCFGGGIDISATGSVTIQVRSWDIRGQVPGAGETISIETANGKLVGPTSYTMPNTAGYGPYSVQFVIEADDTPSTGNIILRSGNEIRFIPLTD